MELLLTGGSACGKSNLGEKLLERTSGEHIYIATMIPYGQDGQAKVERHIKQRQDKDFIVLEKYTDLRSLSIPVGSSVLLECICNLTANEMFEKGGAGENTVSAVLEGMQHIREPAENIIVITNEVGNDGGTYDAPVLDYIDKMGAINNALAANFENVYEMCCGIPIRIKGDLSWEQ